VYRIVPSGLCFVLSTHLEQIGLTRNCFASWELIVGNVLLRTIDVHSSPNDGFQVSCCGLSMASAYVNGSLSRDVDVRAFAMMIGVFTGTLT